MIFCSEIRQNLLQTIGRNHIPIHYREIISQFITEVPMEHKCYEIPFFNSNFFWWVC